ncbi:hypothetical protein [Psychrobacter phenylpyruvicus]|uniref:Lipopolysaccharide core biosynthesis protein n=1 Tax=Psychrobacter phenylpyruvicus TaxID=29432 RepID=A0A379LMM3_9GAMM|nr:hypothetical protein [Psychrobacter phenylpyruvicus]SUD91022.1 lipopolysaccharide core biosynthesis protein [Psychrobacter phenylpyruvicus]
MLTPKYIDIKTSNGSYSIKTFDKQNVSQSLKGLSVNIFASGPSITKVKFEDDLLSGPSIFVNGSLTLTAEHDFTNIVAYVISDERFIKHNSEILEHFYAGQPLYITKPVIEAIAIKLPHIIEKYQHCITIIYPVDRPIVSTNKVGFLNSLPLVKKIGNKKLSLADFKDHPDFVIDTSSYSKPIGVSLNIERGFVEAGTVAFVAAQLAYTLDANQINLYGIDLINSNQPRFYEKQDNAAPCKLDKAITDRIVPSFDLLGKVYGIHGTQVNNKSNISKFLFKNI